MLVICQASFTAIFLGLFGGVRRVEFSLLMLASDFFTQARLREMRDEICRGGFVADNFLGDNPDRPVFGVNLACLYPFPAEVRETYRTLSGALGRIDSAVYVYPFWETHVTIATFINFTQHVSPTAQRVAELSELMRKVGSELDDMFGDVKRFDLWIEHPVISRKAAILPLSDPVGAIAEIRKRVVEKISPELRTRLDELGFNVPPLVHSTVMRFKKFLQTHNVSLRNLTKYPATLLSRERCV